MSEDARIKPGLEWFAARGWEPFAFQKEVWGHYLEGRSGLLHAPTGMGKTLAVALGPMLEAVGEIDERGGKKKLRSLAYARGSKEGEKRKKARGLQMLWLTPLRALANDTAEALKEVVAGLGLDWSVELRTGDTSATVRKKQRETGLPSILVTTPESLSVLLSYPEANTAGGPLSGVRCVVVDEWHELMGSKRGVQAELGLARLRTLNPELRTWGLSATLGNLQEAMGVLLGTVSEAGVLVRGEGRRKYEFHTVIPADIERFPWAGHLGLRLLEPVIEQIERARTTLLFTNVRSQTEIWFAALLRAKPEWLGQIGVHHGSLDRRVRARVEEAIKAGELKVCVCTSSLDLGVDFAPVDQVIQVGSPKGVARFLQRAGRSGHQPGGLSRVVCVPTHALELVEFAAASEALTGREEEEKSSGGLETRPPRARGPVDVESRVPLTLALDVLCQHMLTLACGGGFDEEKLKAEVRRTNAYRELTERQWGWAMDYVQRGGPALGAYPGFARVVLDPETGLWRAANAGLARMHRLNIGTITSEQAVTVKFATGRTLGSVEEGFIGKMRPGDVFSFAGRILKLVRLREMVATVRLAPNKSGVTPAWMGSRMALSRHLAEAVRKRLGEADRGILTGPEMEAVGPILAVQKKWSALPQPGVTLIELARTPAPSAGFHAFVYPLEGRLAHEGLATLAAWRFARMEPRSCSVSANDYGFHLMSTAELPGDEGSWRAALSPENLAHDLLACLNAAELARRAFREIARVAGLISQGYPGQRKTARYLQASSGLFFDVFSEYDPENLLLEQARREVLEKQLEFARMKTALEQMQGLPLKIVRVERLTPFGFPLWVDALRNELSSEKWADRVKRMLGELEREAG